MDDLPGGPLLAERLDKAVREVCPIHGISIGRRQNEAGEWARDTWRVNPKPEASLDEIQAAYDVLAAFDPDAVDEPEEPATVEEHKFPAPDERLSDWDVVGANDAAGVIPSDIASRLAGIGINPREGETMPAFTARLRAHYNEIAGKRHAGIGDIEVIDAEIEIISAVLDQIIALTPKVGS